MSRISLSKLVLVLTLVTLLAAPSTGRAAGRRFSSDGTWPRSSALEDLMATFWSYLIGLSEKAGCGLDPSGCKSPSSDTPTKNGCGIDPHGGCTAGTGSSSGSTTNTEAGCGIDPHGGCVNGG